jgi:hypothetical protein
MKYLKRFISVLSVVAISTLILSSATLAQNTGKFVKVGTDSDGDPFLLDTTTMGKREAGFGSVLRVYQIKNDIMSETLLNAECGDENLSVVGLRTYNQGVKLTEEKVRQPLQVRTDSPGSQAMTYFCHAIGARGW